MTKRVVNTLVVLVAVAVVATAVVRKTRQNPVPKTTRVASLDGFLASGTSDGSDRGPVVFIGIDGAAWQFIDPLIAKGELPNLARLKREGAHGNLRSTPCYVSPPAWATMLTGYLPEKTGVYTYGTWDRDKREFISVNADDIEVPSVWDVASYAGRNVGVFNVPMTYPPRPINGAMVTGMMTPVDMGEPIEGYPCTHGERCRPRVKSNMKSFSPILRTAIHDSLNTYLWSLYDTVDDRLRNYDRVFLTVVSVGAEDAPRSYASDIDAFSPWVRVLAKKDGGAVDAWCKIAIVNTDDGKFSTRMSPKFYGIDVPYTYPDVLASSLKETFEYYAPSQFVGSEFVPSLAREAAAHAAHFYKSGEWDLYLYVFRESDNIHHLTGFSPAAVDVYKTIDRFIGDVMDDMDGKGTIVIASDHGFGRYTYGVDLNQLFAQSGLLRWRDEGEIDYENTLVFHNIWHLYLNRELIADGELERRGIDVPPSADPVDFFMTHLQDLSTGIQRPDGGGPIGIEFHRMPGERTGNTPDMGVMGTFDEYVVDFLGVDNPHPSTLRGLERSEQWWHIRDGILLVWGDGVRQGLDVGSNDIQDVAPTLLYLLDLPVAADMDGHIIENIFEHRKDVFVVDDYSKVRRATVAEDVDREALDKKLRSLGYVQ